MAKLFEFKLVIHRLIKHLEKKELTDSERYMIDGAKKFLQRHSSVEDCLRESEQPEVKTDRQKAIEWWEDSSTLLTVPIWMKKYNMPHLCRKAIEDWEVEIIWRGEIQPKDTSGMQCKCKDSSGQTSVMCCNDCGLPTEGFWTKGK